MNNIFDLPLLQYALKFIFITSASLYLVYTFIVFRQIQVMRKTLITSFSLSVNLLGFVNLILAIGLVVCFWLFL